MRDAVLVGRPRGDGVSLGTEQGVVGGSQIEGGDNKKGGDTRETPKRRRRRREEERRGEERSRTRDGNGNGNGLGRRVGRWAGDDRVGHVARHTHRQYKHTIYYTMVL